MNYSLFIENQRKSSEGKMSRIIIQLNGVGYCYRYESGRRLSKYYSTINRLYKYGALIYQ